MSARTLLGLAALATTSLVLPAAAQERAPTGARAAAGGTADPALHAWRSTHGDAWRARNEPGTGAARFLAGGALPAEAVPQSEGEWFALAERRVDEALPLFEVDPATLERAEVKHLDLVRIGTTDKTVVRFRQRAGGVPVRGGTLSALFGMDGELLALDSTCLPDADELDPEPFVPEVQALRAARERFELDEGVPAEAADELELVVARHEELGELRARLAWSVGLVAVPAQGDTRSRRVLVAADASGGGVLESRSRVHHAFPQGAPPPPPQHGQPHRVNWARQHLSDTIGYVGTYATPGIEADWAGNPPAFEPLPFAWVTSAGGTATTTRNGRFALPNPGGGSATVTFRYQGPWARVVNASGPDSFLTALVPPGAAQLHLMNAPADPLETAEANAFLRINDVRRFVTELDPSDATMDFQAQAFVDAFGSCGESYTGSFIGFFRPSAGCNNTAFSTIVAHEMGHWANDRYGSGNGPDGFGEGAADTWAMYIHDTRFVGERFFPGGGRLRDGENTTQFCGDGNGGCHGQVHDDGEVLMGALWKVRRNLNGSLGDALGDLTADVLFLSWMQAFDDFEIHSIIEDHWIVLDDDDGNLSNGTPHFAEIDGAFVEQGFPGSSFGGRTPVLVAEFEGASTGSEGRFGWSVDIDGDTMVVGSPWDSIPNQSYYAGCANVYERVGGTWIHRQKLVASDTGAKQMFGSAVAIDGTRMVIGAEQWPGTLGAREGAAYVYERYGGTWTETARLTGSHSVDGDLFGCAVDIDDDTIVVGAKQSWQGPGTAYVFVGSGTSWPQQTKLSGSDTGWLDLFGHSVAVEGDQIVIGASNHDHSGSNDGAAYVFDFVPGSGWLELTELTAPSGVWSSQFGIAVDLSGSRLAIGTNQSPRIFLFQGAGASWTHSATIEESFNYFGNTLALDGDVLVAGNPTPVSTESKAWACESVGGAWTSPVELEPNGTDHIYYAKDVAVSGSTIVVGEAGSSSELGGKVHVFELQ